MCCDRSAHRELRIAAVRGPEGWVSVLFRQLSRVRNSPRRISSNERHVRALWIPVYSDPIVELLTWSGVLVEMMLREGRVGGL